MKRFALIGHPLAGSLSPVLFSAAYDGRYPYDLLDYPAFEDAWMAFLEEGYTGINVTAPFKQDAFAAVDRLSPAARLTGAVNLVVRRGGALWGYNTDVDGVQGALGSAVMPSALVVGTGGAARAAVAACLQLGCEVTVAGRSPEKVSALAAAFGCSGCDLAACGALQPSLVVYSLPSSAPVPSGLPLADAIVLEAEYKRPSLDQVQCRRYISGRQWLLWQAMAGYKLFTGEEPSLEKMSAAL